MCFGSKIKRKYNMARPVDLLKLAQKEFVEFINSFDYVLSDCDGVIWTPKPNLESGSFVNLMKKLGKKVHFVSNNSIRPKENYENNFKASGIENGYDNLTVPSSAILEYLKSINFDRHVYSVSCDETNKLLESNGIKVKTGPTVCPESYLDFGQYLDDDLDIGAVVFDSDFKTNLAQVHKAVTYLRRSDVLFLNGATDHHVSYRPGTLSLGPAIFADEVAKEVKRTPIQLAKPGKAFAEFVMKRVGIKPEDAGRVLFIGDMIDQDIKLGKVAGFKSLLVLTNTSLEQMENHPIKPDFYAPSLGSLIPQIKAMDI